MKVLWPRWKSEAFTLVELLTVIAIIGILAALLLPALTKATARAKRVECIGDLRELGTAFHLFAHDHQGKFPMQTPTSDGGSLEFVEAGYQINGEFYFSYRHFQTLSHDLGVPKILICPSDLGRQAAKDFAALQNSNVSYFVGVNANYNQSMSILAGDRNLTNNFSPSPTLVRGTYGVRWTRELHFFKGNVLFADTHVEELNNLRLNLPEEIAAKSDFFLPTINPGTPASPASPADVAPTPTSSSTRDQSNPTSNSPLKNNNPNPPTNSPETRSNYARTSISTRMNRQDSSDPALTEFHARETNAIAAPDPPPVATAPATNEAEETPLLWLLGAAGALVRKAGWWLLLLLLLLLATTLYFYARRKMREQRKRMEE